jgi:hypothetical protein
LSGTDWQQERDELIKRLQDAARVAGESQAEAAVYRELLEDWHEVAQMAETQRDFSLLHRINKARAVPFYLPNPEEGKSWAKYFLHAYARDAHWLEHAKKALERIKSQADKLPEDTGALAELKKSIIETAEDGLITHV